MPPPSESPELKTLAKVLDRLNRAKILYMLTGSMALNFYGHPRATNDFDIVIEMKAEDEERVFRLFENDFYISREAVREAVSRERLFNVIDYESVFKVDLIIRKKDPLSVKQFQRRSLKEFMGLKAHVISPEDLVLAKYRPDTTEEAQKVYDEMVRGLTEEERFLRGISLTHFSRQMCLAGIRDRFPGITDGDLKARIFESVYGEIFSPDENEKIIRFLREGRSLNGPMIR